MPLAAAERALLDTIKALQPEMAEGGKLASLVAQPEMTQQKLIAGAMPIVQIALANVLKQYGFPCDEKTRALGVMQGMAALQRMGQQAGGEKITKSARRGVPRSAHAAHAGVPEAQRAQAPDTCSGW